MRIAIVSDIHGNLTALETVLHDLRQTSPDLIFHGGDLAASGSSPCEVVDRICELGWPGVAGNADEMLFAPETLQRFAEQSPGFKPLFPIVEEMAAATRALLGEKRLAWLRALPLVQVVEQMALVHARPGDPWRSPAAEASDEELESIYGALSRPLAVYGHIHQPFVRRVGKSLVANSGSVSLSYDGDPRASYLLIDDAERDAVATIRRVEYDVELECRSMIERAVPHAAWVGSMLRSGRFQMP